jgi:peroxiredoxin
MHGRRILVGVVAGWVMAGSAIAAVAAVSALERPAGPAVERSGQARPGGPAPVEPSSPSRTQLIAELEASIASLKADHKALTDELQAIAALANQENSPKTAERTKRLIQTRQKEFQSELMSLERRLNGLQKTLNEEDRKARQANRLGTQAPLFSLKGPDGKEVKLSDFKGKIVVLEWVNPDSPSWVYSATKKTMADLTSKHKDVVWLAIHSTSGSSAAANKRAMDRYSLPYPILDDSTGQTARQYAATTTPEVYVIDAKGTIVYVGAIDNSPMGRAQGQAINYVDRALTEVSEGKPVTIPQTKPYGTPVLGGR